MCIRDSLYTRRGRGDDKGKPVIRRHKYAVAFTAEMDYENVQSAPGSPELFESSQQYLHSANIAIQLTMFLKNLGYDSRAHIDGDYEVICPLVARDAGLGEIGRMGLLMTPLLGPRVRIAVVTTNAPLLPDQYRPDRNMIEFCRVCKKCADCCPGNSIPTDDIQEINGVRRWKIDSDSCYHFWCTSGTDCGRCMAVCPFSHRNNLFHNTIRFLIRYSCLVARIAYYADDLFYGRKPISKSQPEWMRLIK
jgi:reductive dehalogenase